jgi:hypothetical protein
LPDGASPQLRCPARALRLPSDLVFRIQTPNTLQQQPVEVLAGFAERVIDAGLQPVAPLAAALDQKLDRLVMGAAEGLELNRCGTLLRSALPTRSQECAGPGLLPNPGQRLVVDRDDPDGHLRVVGPWRKPLVAVEDEVAQGPGRERLPCRQDEAKNGRQEANQRGSKAVAARLSAAFLGRSTGPACKRSDRRVGLGCYGPSCGGCAASWKGRPYQASELEYDRDRHVVRRLVPAAGHLVDLDFGQPVGRLG